MSRASAPAEPPEERRAGEPPESPSGELPEPPSGEPSESRSGEPPEFRFSVAGMDCAGCARTLERGVRDLEGVDTVRVDFTTERLEGRGRVSFGALSARVRALGYRLVEDAEQNGAPDGADAARREAAMRSGPRGFLVHAWNQPHTRLALILGAGVLALLAARLSGAATVPAAWIAAAHWLVIAAVGYPIAARGARSLVYAKRITIELLMTVATLGAVAIGASGEAVTIVLLFTLGEALEGYSAARSRSSLRALLELRPTKATRVRRQAPEADAEQDAGPGPGASRYEEVDVAALEPGDRVLVKAGERVPADGRIVEGDSGIDESAITGESVPVHKAAGDEVHAGTINGQGTLEVAVSCRAEDFTISQIARLVAEAQAGRSPAERFIDRFAQWYTPAVVLLAVAVALVPPLAFGQPFLTPAEGAPGWLYRGLTLLIIACPCALIISIPVTVVSALTRLASLGVLVKGGARLNALASTRVFAFDKTGTLTRGRPAVSGVRSRGCTHVEPAAGAGACAPCDEVVAVAASLEHGSSHPLAHAVLEAAAERRLEHRHPPATAVRSQAGRGVTGTLNGREVTVGHPALFVSAHGLDALLADPIGSAGSLVLVGDERGVLGYIEVQDRPREEIRAALEALRRIDEDIRVVMLTGDRREAAETIAARIGGIDEIRAELLPEQKLAAVRELEARHGDVAMIGDGINDTPALAGAKLGIAMGGAGSHQAMEVADIVLMGDDLGQLPRAVAISRKTWRVVRENIALSLGLKLVFIALAIPGIATLWMAVLADVGATVLVTLNGMRMLRAQ